ncbi:cation efflux family-domain-containing protein [Morchella snyderi]|nr:cation efflux family-domain-containing protein [Morchella snyderi]
MASPAPRTPLVAPPTPDTDRSFSRHPSFSLRRGSTTTTAAAAAAAGLGIAGLPTPESSTFDAAALAPPADDIFPPNYNLSSSTPSTPPSASLNKRGSGSGPFNFQPMVASKSPPVGKPNQRRGHRYKHSSISHQIFLEPPARAPLVLPASLPIPTRAELLHSLTPPQRTRLLWCACHLSVALLTHYSAADSLAVTALAHLLVFDALSACVCLAADALANFEVWQRSSVRHPFGLERAEVLAGFAMAVLLLFMGFDTLSHAAEHLVEGLFDNDGGGGGGGESPHAAHMHAVRVSAGSVDLAALAALASSLVSGLVLKNHARIGRAVVVASAVQVNPAHLLTVVASLTLLVLPLASVGVSSVLDRGMAVAMAVAMVAMGVRLVRVLGGMLLMSYGGAARVAEVVRAIEEDEAVTGVVDARFWQVHHGLCMACLKVGVAAGAVGEAGEKGLRERVGRLVRERLGGGGAGPGRVRWEVSVQVTGGKV